MSKILVVDDEEMIRRLLKKFLEDRGYDVCTAGTGKEALERIKDAPDIVLLDIMLPDMDGMEIFNRAKAIIPSPRVILMSGMDRDSDYLTHLDSHVEFIAKPMNLRDLEQLLQTGVKRDDILCCSRKL
ncbi:MAG: response regulator transcription factor [Deltaproteobacteria bacterium]|nr:response regulator transcription factor [Deltaproteobacteria bacterium]MBW2137693.1 response regulator transcription factor [Deltaproteobacteria bacterium]